MRERDRRHDSLVGPGYHLRVVPRRGARAAESARLESVCGATHRGFESHSLRSGGRRSGDGDRTGGGAPRRRARRRPRGRRGARGRGGRQPSGQPTRAGPRSDRPRRGAGPAGRRRGARLVATRRGHAGGHARALPDVRRGPRGGTTRPGRVRRREHRQRRPAAPSTTSAPTRGSTTRSRSCTACWPSRPPRCSTASSPPAAPDRLGRARGRWLTWPTESCQSGRMGRSRKPLWLSGHRGFESHALRSRTTRRCPASRRTLGTDHVSCARQLRGRRPPSPRCAPG